MKLMHNRVVVTGGCGYIGSLVVRELVKRSIQVRVVDKQYFGTSGIEQLPNVELINADVRNVDPRWFINTDAVIHLASLSNDPTADFDEGANYSINYVASVNLAKAAKQQGVKVFTFASSAGVYGFHVEEVAEESHPLLPLSSYSESKILAEKDLLALADSQFSPVIFRQGTLFGSSSRMRWDLVINTMLKNALQKKEITIFGTGITWRPVVHIQDVVFAHIESIFNEKTYGKVFNLVGENLQLKQLAEAIQNILAQNDISVNLRYTGQNDNRSYRIDGAAFQSVFPEKRFITVQEGTEEMLEKLKSGEFQDDFDNPIYNNLRWMQLLIDCEGYFQRYSKAL